MNREDIDSFAVKANIGSDKARKSSDGRYVSVPLPDEILDLGFEVGDKISLKLESAVVDAEEVDFIRCNDRDIGRHSLQLRRREDFNPERFIRIPIEYTYYRENQAFHGLDKDDDLVVEVNRGIDEFRIYRSEDYSLRLRELSNEDVFPEMKTPSVAVVASQLVKSFFSEKHVKIVDHPDTVQTGQTFQVLISIKLPDLEAVLLQRRRDGAKGWADMDRFTEIDGDKSTMVGYGELDSVGDHELRVRAYYGESEISFSRDGEWNVEEVETSEHADIKVI